MKRTFRCPGLEVWEDNGTEIEFTQWRDPDYPMMHGWQCYVDGTRISPSYSMSLKSVKQWYKERALS